MFSVYMFCFPGWRLNPDEQLEIDWLSLPAAPRSILEMISCGCRSGCKDGHCSCRRHSLQCTDVCRCHHSSASVNACSNCDAGDPAIATNDDEDEQQNE